MKATCFSGLAGLCLIQFFALGAFGQAGDTKSQLAVNTVATPSTLRSPDYKIGAEDVLEVAVFEDPTLGGTARVAGSGAIVLPLLGVVQAAGLTPIELGKSVEDSLRRTYIKDPHVTVAIKDYASQPVNMLGAFRSPGIYQIKGEKRLMDMLAMVGGLNGSSKAIQVNRTHSGSAEPSSPEVITINSEDLFENALPEANISIYAGDIVYALPAPEPIYLLGEVIRPGQYDLRNGKAMTLGQAITVAGGFTREADKKKLTIIRYQLDGTKVEIPVVANGKNLLDLATSDVRLEPNDILVVPPTKNKAKFVGNRAIDAAISIVSSRLIWRY